MRISIGGHRGLGMTDSAFARQRNEAESASLRDTTWPRDTARPGENTLESLLGALRAGADFIETDAIATADGEIVLAHSNDPSVHICPPQKGIPGKRFIDEMTLAEVQSLHTGLDGKGRIPTLRALLRALNEEFPGGGRDGIILNLELKGVQATPRATAQAPALVTPVLDAIRHEGFPLDRILFSSFSVATLEELAAREPCARTALLFYTAPPGSNYADTVLFDDGSELYIPFRAPDIAGAIARLPLLEVLIPEIQDLTPETVALAARRRLALMTYGYPEESPLKSEKFAEAARKALGFCREQDVSLGLITDYVAGMRLLTGQEASVGPLPAKAAKRVPAISKP